MNIWVEPPTYQWVRKKAFDRKISQAVLVEEIIKKEMKKDERRNNND